MAGELGQQTVELGTVVRQAAEESYLALRDLVEKSRAADTEGEGGQQRSDTEKKIDLLKFIDRTRQRMLRLHVLAKWCQQVPLVHYCQQLASTLSSHETCFTQTGDSLFFMHEGLQQARAPIFDVPSAIEVIHTGSYRRVPKCVEEIGTQNTLFQDERKPTLKKLSTLVRAKLLETVVPKEISEVSVTDGIANVQVDGEFKVLTLGYRGHFSLWRILHMELLVGEKTGPIKLEETRRYVLGDDIERRMAVADNPFTILYSILHELCISFVMDTVIRQTNVLRQGRWKEAIKSELISDSHTSAGQGGNNAPTQLGQDGELDSSGFRIPGLKVNYWLDERNSGSAESDSSPFIKVEALQDMQIKCQHSSFVLDPLTDKEADLSLDLSCIDVEALIFKAIACNRHTRLLEIERELKKNIQISRSPTDVVLKREEVHMNILQKRMDRRDFENFCTNEVLQVRAYGQSYIQLGINIRSGGFLLQSPKNILPPSAILESEEALNKGGITPAEVFVSLKTRSILHLFAATGRFLGLKVYSQCQITLKIPKSILYGSDFMVMGFPWRANAYYLLMQLDNNLMPAFYLLEVHTDGEDRSNADATSDAKEAVRFNRIDIGQMQICEDECSANLLNVDKLQVLQSMLNCRSMEDRSPRQSGIDESLPLKASFSSVVHAVLGYEQGSPSKENRLSYSLPSTHLSSLEVSFQGVSGRACPPELDDSLLHSNIDAAKVASGVSLNSYLLSNSKSETSGSVPAGLENLSTLRSVVAFGKRSLSNFLLNIPSSQRSMISGGPSKRRKLPEDASSTQSGTILTYGSILAEGNRCITENIYASVLLQVIKHCLLRIKYAQLTTQLKSLNIPYVEEVGLATPSSNLWLRLPFAPDGSWKHICLRLGKAGSMSWDVRINDPYYGALWKLHGGSTTAGWGSRVRIANTSEMDSHISFDDDGVILTYNSVEVDSIQRLVSELQRLSNARVFACGMRRLVRVKVDEKLVQNQLATKMKLHSAKKGFKDRLSDHMIKTFRIDAVGLMNLWFSYGANAMPMVHFVVEWDVGKVGCTMRVSPDHLWPHTKFLEDFVNCNEVASLLDCIRLTAGPLLSLGGAIRPAKMPAVSAVCSSAQKQNGVLLANGSSSTTLHMNNHDAQTSSMLSAAGRTGSGPVPSSLMPFDVSVVLRGPYWIRIIYRNKFSVDMRCFAGDQVWLQPATPPKGGPSVGGSLPCPQFRPFIMEHVAQGLNTLEPSFLNARHIGPHLNASANTLSGSQQVVATPNPLSGGSPGVVKLTPSVGSQIAPSVSRAGNAVLPSSGFPSGTAGASAHLSPGTNLPVHMKGELNTAFIGIGDDGGYGGGWVPHAALKKVLRSILKYLGVLWLFAQLPDLLKDILGSVLKDNEGALLNLDQEQPALRFFVGGYVFAVSVHRVQLVLQVLNVKRFHHQQQQQQAPQSSTQEELTPSEIHEMCDYFSRCVACEPYDASRIASFIMLLTLPIPVMQEFLKLIAWNKSLSQPHGDIATAQRARAELCLEKHSRSFSGDYTETSLSSKSNIHHDRANNSVDFTVTFMLDHNLTPHMSTSGGAGWLPYCVSLRLRYTFGDNSHIAYLAMDGSHGGRACWLQHEDWERCKQSVVKAVKTVNGSPATGETGQGRLQMVAEMIQKQLQLQLGLLHLRDGSLSAGSTRP